MDRIGVDELLRQQAGVISREQALDEGMSTSAIARRLATSRWRRILPRVYLATDRELTDEARLRAVGLWAGEDATLSGVAAAWWHKLGPPPPSIVEVTVPWIVRFPTRANVRVRRRNLERRDRHKLNGLWVTSVPLTVLEVAVALGDEGQVLLDRALQQRRVSFESLYRVHCRTLGRHGSASARRLLATAADRAASQAERLTIKLLRAAKVTGWRLHYIVGGYELDLAFEAERVAIEVDGWAWHTDPERFRHDRQRQNALVLAGWTVLRFTWHDLTNRPAEVIAQVKAALARPQAA
jgi:very-short-patch-repair endonuclease